MTFVFHQHPDIGVLGDLLDNGNRHPFFQHDRYKCPSGHVRGHEFELWLADLYLFNPAKPNDPNRLVQFGNFAYFLKIRIEFLIGNDRQRIVILFKDGQSILNEAGERDYYPFFDLGGHKIPFLSVKIVLAEPHNIGKALAGEAAKTEQVANPFQPRLTAQILLQKLKDLLLGECNNFIPGFPLDLSLDVCKSGSVLVVVAGILL